jgi:hypothetical protein
MAKRKHSKARTTLYATVALALCVVPPFLMSSSSGGCGCQLDTSPLRPGKQAPITDDNDSGESK